MQRLLFDLPRYASFLNIHFDFEKNKQQNLTEATREKKETNVRKPAQKHNKYKTTKINKLNIIERKKIDDKKKD